jgi:ATP-dependent Clp protease protease subunit
MIHQPTSGFHGQASDIEIQSREMRRTREALNKILPEITGRDVERIAVDTE